MDHTQRKRRKNTQNRALHAQGYCYCYDHGCYCYLAFSNRHLRRLGIPADWPLQGPVFSWNLLLFHPVTFAPALGSSWGGEGQGALPSCCRPESSGLQLSPFSRCFTVTRFCEAGCVSSFYSSLFTKHEEAISLPAAVCQASLAQPSFAAPPSGSCASTFLSCFPASLRGKKKALATGTGHSVLLGWQGSEVNRSGYLISLLFVA